MRLQTKRCGYGIAAAAAMTVAALAGSAAPAQAANLTINPIFDSSITTDPNAGIIQATINAAIAEYEAKYSDPITVNIRFQEMGSGLGQSSTFFATVAYSSYLTALTADAKTVDDAAALASLGVTVNNPVTGTGNINVKTANLRAVGININPPGGNPDGTIGLNTSIMNLTRVGPQNSGFYDLKAVVQHEIDEVLGLGSAIGFSSNPFPQDLFRYSAPGVRSFSTSGAITSYFSINGGTTNLISFNQSGAGDYGDWLTTGAPKVQDAFGTPGSQPNLGVELRNLDVIGYDLASTAPEPSSFALLFGAAAPAALLAARRRRRNRA